MRHARSNDVWRHLFRTPLQPVKSICIQYADVSPLGSGELVIDKPMTLICGENGAGKTTLLKLLHRALWEGTGEWSSIRELLPPLVLTGTVTGFSARLGAEPDLHLCTSPAEFHERLSTSAQPVEISFVDTASLVPTITHTIRADQNFSDLLEGLSPRFWKEESLNAISQLVGRSYSAVEVFEIDDYAPFGRFPYFRVRFNEVQYGSECMGMGELALFHLYWVIDSAREGSLLLLEEPESFVAPRSQRIFIDWLAAQCLQKKLLAVVASHSGVIAERFPQDGIVLCTRTREGAIAQRNPPPHILVERLGILSHRRCLLLAEDEAARALTVALLRELEPRLQTECEVIAAGSSGAITAALRAVPMVTSRRIVLIGVYDGDQEGLVPADVRWPHVLLPGGANPELFIQDLMLSSPLEQLSERLGLNESIIRTALGGADGREPHDWLGEVCRSLEASIGLLANRVVPLWIAANPNEARRFGSQILEASRRPALL